MKSGTQYCRLIHIPEVIGSEDDRENSYFPLILARIDKNEDSASMTEPCEMSNDYERDVMRKYINKVLEEGKLPQRITTDHPRTYAFLRDFCHTLGIILELKRVSIHELNELCQYMCEFGL